MNQKNAILIMDTLKQAYPEAKCSLDFRNPFELLIAVILSAQCTDERVNKTTPSIFAKCPTPEAFVSIPISELEDLIHPCGFYKTKSKNIKATCQILVEKYHSKVPQTMEELMSLPGVGRKTANVVLLEAFHKPVGIAVDTHAKRLANRIGFSKESDPLKIEQDLLKLLPSSYLADVNHLFIYHGRNVCTARQANCKDCVLSSLCEKNISNSKK